MICVECGDDEVDGGVDETSMLCSYCLEVPQQSEINVRKVTQDHWAVTCWTCDLYDVFYHWHKAYEAAVGHACMHHKQASVCRRKGHAWKRVLNTVHTCTRCGEPGYEVFGEDTLVTYAS